MRIYAALQDRMSSQWSIIQRDEAETDWAMYIENVGPKSVAYNTVKALNEMERANDTLEGASSHAG